MKLFTKAALVSAIAVSGSAYAMQAMDDSALSSATGQDGITILIALPGNTLKIDQIAIFDGNGFAAGSGYPSAQEAGAIVLGKNGNGAGAAAGAAPTAGTGFSINTSGAIGLVIDSSGGGASGATSGAAPVLNVNVQLPTNFSITTGDISVAGAQLVSGKYLVDANTTTGKGAVKILNSMTIGLGGATMNIQLGNPNQGAMIVAGGTITNGLSIANLGVTDNTLVVANAGTLNVGNLTLTSNGSANLNLAATVDVVNTSGLTAAGFVNPNGTAVTAGGLVIGLGTLASGNFATGTYTANSAKYDAYMQAVTLGDAASTLGDVRVTGLDLTGVKIAIQGH